MEKLDSLLGQYLTLLDKYQQARAQLSKDLSSGFFSLARANFASSGQRYGQDYYDERMQATRRIRADDGASESTSTFSVVHIEPEADDDDAAKAKKAPKKKAVGGMTIGGEEQEDKLETYLDLLHLNSKATENSAQKLSSASANGDGPAPNGDALPKPPDTANEAPNPPKAKKNKNDPIHMFGLFTPPALRQAQVSFIGAVDECVPKLVELDAEMKGLEIEIRRTRKLLAKAA